MPGMGKMKHVSLTLQVENDLKHQLSIGALKPGARLITKNLAEQLGMSITPVREALLRLEIGALAAWTPAKIASIEPYTAVYYPKIFEQKNTEIHASTIFQTLL